MVDLSRVEGGMGAPFTLIEPPRLTGVAPNLVGCSLSVMVLSSS
jgi:hypothetical protein